MTNHENVRSSTSVFGGLCLLLAVAMSVAGTGRAPATPPGTAGSARIAPVALEITPGVARADTDVLDLQLD
jgi:hypothetical protein